MRHLYLVMEQRSLPTHKCHRPVRDDMRARKCVWGCGGGVNCVATEREIGSANRYLMTIKSVAQSPLADGTGFQPARAGACLAGVGKAGNRRNDGRGGAAWLGEGGQSQEGSCTPAIRHSRVVGGLFFGLGGPHLGPSLLLRAPSWTPGLGTGRACTPSKAGRGPDVAVFQTLFCLMAWNSRWPPRG